MALSLDREAQSALDLAKRCVPEGHDLQPRDLLCALYHGTSVKDRRPGLRSRVPEPVPVTAEPGNRRVPDALWAVLEPFDGRPSPGTAADLFSALARSTEGRTLLAGFGVSAEEVSAISVDRESEKKSAELAWRNSRERAEVIETLSEYGRMLTAIDLRPANLFGVDEAIKNIQRGLVQRKQHGVILIGPPGVGKTAVVQEFARRIATGDPSVLDRLRDRDIFELSPAFLKAGASIVGQFEERIKSLLETVTNSPNVIVFVDEVHSLLQSEMHTQGPWSGASAEFKKAVGSGSISLIGCTTLAEYRHYIEPDRALADRFTVVHIDPPTPEETEQILNSRMTALRAYYSELTIPDDIVPVVVHLTEEHLLGRYQPRKSIRLLDQACAWCLVQQPPAHEVTELAVRSALETETGQRLVSKRTLRADDLRKTLEDAIVGQDDILEAIADAVVKGLSSLSDQATRGNFFFAGPTGVGKTEAAKVLADALGGGRRSLVRIDCNALQGSGVDSRSATNTLLGSPPGYIGYVRGEGGLLSKVKDTPDCVVLFDEIEKADPGVAKLLLQILDEGLVDDVDGNPLDFRHALLIFTSNAGVTYGSGSGPLGFQAGGQKGPVAAQASVSRESVMDDLRRHGFPQEFVGRHFDWFVFGPLTTEHGREILRRLLVAFQASLHERRPPVDLEWEPDIIERLVGAWAPEFGARGLQDLLRNRVVGELAVAEADNKLENVTRILLRARAAEQRPPGVREGASVFGHRGDVATIDLY